MHSNKTLTIKQVIKNNYEIASSEAEGEHNLLYCTPASVGKEFFGSKEIESNLIMLLYTLPFLV